MQDAADPYNRLKYSKQSQQPQVSGSGRGAMPYLSTEDSSASQRYSPMNTLSPTSPYSSNQGSYTYAQHRQSPSRSNNYTSASQTYYSSQGGSPRTSVSYGGGPNSGQAPGPTSRQTQVTPGQSQEPDGDMYYSPQSTAFTQEAKSPRRLHAQQLQQQPGSRGPVPKFSELKSVRDLEPKIHEQPAFRRANPEGGFISPLQALTLHLPSTYRICNPNFKYESSRNPRRVLTKPSKGVKNDGYDNEDSDYILYVNDILGSEETGHKNRYLILDVLGQGTFGQVVKCQNLKTQEVVAVKVVKNRTAYFNQSMMELNSKLDKNDDHHLLRLKDTFIHRQHLCLVFELLSVNLYELIKQNQFRGLSTTLVRVFAQQLLNGMSLLNKARLIHCDLKPENILLKK
ncbi:hypothetical protein GP486_000167 [Trichoglossum hirsutum]|uniref:Protein kinase domain-containing protein n=1 Tax=Trichoglossum hirsutum TaxID=265104 RepID=A0A9P8LIC1_9PEZI|nr:hypothetical protein GP486_000167 [Trichoglossum hirsutum]